MFRAIPCEWTRTQLTSSFETEDIFQEEHFFTLGIEGFGHRNRVGTPPDTTKARDLKDFSEIFYPERSKEILVLTAIVNSFSSSRRIALIDYFPLEVNGGRFLPVLVAFRNSATRRHSEIKQNRSTTKQEFSGEALSKQDIGD